MDCDNSYSCEYCNNDVGDSDCARLKVIVSEGRKCVVLEVCAINNSLIPTIENLTRQANGKFMAEYCTPAPLPYAPVHARMIQWDRPFNDKRSVERNHEIASIVINFSKFDAIEGIDFGENFFQDLQRFIYEQDALVHIWSPLQMYILMPAWFRSLPNVRLLVEMPVDPSTLCQVVVVDTLTGEPYYFETNY